MLRDLLSRLAGEGIAADDRGVDLVDRSRPQAEIVPVSAVVHLRDEPDPRSALLTQAVLGEPLDLMVRREGWLLVRTGDGYMGWVRRGGLSEPGEEYRRLRETGAEARVRVREVLLREAPDERAAPVREAVFDSRLICMDRRDTWTRVVLADGIDAWVPGSALAGPGDMPRYPGAGHVLEAATSMLGAPYLWGGTSPKGFDCSGLVQRVFGHFGVLLPRDADRMQGALEGAWRGGEGEPGDILFFGEERPDHVGIALGGGAFLHASRWVRIQSLDPASRDYRSDLAASYRGAARVPPLGRPVGLRESG
jgi:SH3-like domain-containing protein